MTLSDDLDNSDLITIIKCADCGESLVEMAKAYNSDKVEKVIAHCSVNDCNGESWVTSLSGEYRMRPTDGRSITDMTYSEEGVSHLYVS